MSKKKNTLKDLDEFLQQQAARLVTPTPLSDKIDAPTPAPQPTPKQESAVSPPGDAMLAAVKQLAADRTKLYDLIVQSVEAQDKSLPEDKMLINTALYLRSGENWKAAIRDYWKSR